MDSSFNAPPSQRSFSGFITSSQIPRDFAELFEGGFEVFKDLLCDPVRLLIHPGQTLVLHSNALLLRSRFL
jgi:hypothetical protein